MFSNVSMFEGSLYKGYQTVEERGFKVGDKVYVGASFSEKEGTIVGLNKEYPFKAQVKLDRKNCGATTCWIKSHYLLKKN